MPSRSRGHSECGTRHRTTRRSHLATSGARSRRGYAITSAVLGLELPHAEFIVAGLLFLILGIALIAIARVWPSTPIVTHVARTESAPLTISADPEALPEPPLAEGVTPFTRTITWPTLIDADCGDLTGYERKPLIEALTLVEGPWVVEILTRAFEEESDDLRIAAIEALAYSPDLEATTTLERAYNSHDVAERYAAIDGASRHADIALLERGTRDTDTTVALAAAYGLHIAHRDDLIDKSLANRDDARANEIRRLLPLLSIHDA